MSERRARMSRPRWLDPYDNASILPYCLFWVAVCVAVFVFVPPVYATPGPPRPACDFTRTIVEDRVTYGAYGEQYHFEERHTECYRLVETR